MSSRFVVEMDGRTVGLALRVAGGYRFFASDNGFRLFEHRTFPRARALLHAIRRGRGPSAPAPAPASASTSETADTASYDWKD
ncbi:hypothetical protein [Sphingomonas sp. SRS2]|uniref:hypothetical protein n=1 Tax=Sphingomonas sp. SRS2 TaxID=133190 RepID=UPI0006184F8B|nr:hypothetical protein [Sphingomonas sp. SRS2]KKC27084.1 hypothetical protein WP12_05225 [Sphingomonas sp. SRS2]